MYLKIATYTKNESTSIQEAFSESLTLREKIIHKKFKRVVTGGKGSKPVPILFSSLTQKFIRELLEIRHRVDIVPKTNPYLFANPKSERNWMSGYHVIRKLATKCGAQNPSLMTSTKFRKQIATTLQLLTMDNNEMEQIAKFMGHTQKIHAELPQDIYQTAKVAKILILLEKGKGHHFKGKYSDEIEFDEELTSDSDDEESITVRNEERSRETQKKTEPNSVTVSSEREIPPEQSSILKQEQELIRKKQKNNDSAEQEDVNTSKFKNNVRVRWTEPEKRIVKNHFVTHINKKIPPKKHECMELLNKNKEELKNKDWVRVKTFVYNAFRNKYIAVFCNPLTLYNVHSNKLLDYEIIFI
ncbi:hypothetical protein HHI36_023895 [Cryptolaemus montrouzieri]|uniref:Uncharacterized protein n=1 Tax=Cryptolaemus montrouzieri TaxID=559131 RepID=A0ABD2MNC9_9CUCU